MVLYLRQAMATLIQFSVNDVQSLYINPSRGMSSTTDVFETMGLDSTGSIPGTLPQEAILRAG